MRASFLFPCCSALAFLSCGAGVGLAQEPELPPEEEEAVEEAPVYRLFEELDALFTEGRTNAVNARFAEAIEDPAFAEIRPNLFENYLVYLLRTEQIEEAKSVYLGAMRTDVELARPVSGFVYGYLSETGRSAEALDWARTLLAQELPDDFRMAATEWLATGLFATGDEEGALSAALDGLAKFPADAFVPIVVRLGEVYLQRYRDSVQYGKGG